MNIQPKCFRRLGNFDQMLLSLLEECLRSYLVLTRTFPVSCICITWPVTSHHTDGLKCLSAGELHVSVPPQEVLHFQSVHVWRAHQIQTHQRHPLLQGNQGSDRPEGALSPFARRYVMKQCSLWNMIFCWFLLYVVPLRASREVQPWHQEVGSYSRWSELPGSVQTAHQSDW